MGGEEVKRRALNLIKKIKFRNGGEKRETKRKDKEEPDIDISIEEIRRRIREEKEAAVIVAQEDSRLEESTDSDFTITYEQVPGSPGQNWEEEEDRIDRNRGLDIASPERSGAEEEAAVGKVKRLSPKQRQRRQSLARFKRKKWREEWIVKQ